jgi:hypothetical protein
MHLYSDTVTEQLKARVKELEERLRRTREVGGLLSNCAYNLSQMKGQTLTDRHCQSLRGVVEAWDEIKKDV